VLLGCIPRLLTTLVVALNVARGHGWMAGALEVVSAASVVGVAVLVPRDALTDIGIGFLVSQCAVAAGAAAVLVRFHRTVRAPGSGVPGRAADREGHSS
jgi:hypothetical protein